MKRDFKHLQCVIASGTIHAVFGPTSGRVASVGQALASHPGAGQRKLRIGAVLFDVGDTSVSKCYLQGPRLLLSVNLPLATA